MATKARPTVLARLFSGLSACFCSTANFWLFVIPCLNLQLQPASPPCSPSFPGASILLNQGCAPLQRAPVTSSLQLRCDAKTHQLKLAASDLPGVSFCQDEKAESRPFPMQAPQHSHVMQNCQEGCLLLISVYRADGFC